MLSTSNRNEAESYAQDRGVHFGRANDGRWYAGKPYELAMTGCVWMFSRDGALVMGPNESVRRRFDRVVESARVALSGRGMINTTDTHTLEAVTSGFPTEAEVEAAESVFKKWSR